MNDSRRYFLAGYLSAADTDGPPEALLPLADRCTGGARLYPMPQGGTAQCSDWSHGGWVQAAPFCTDAYGNGLTVLGPKTSYGVSRKSCPAGAPYLAYAGVRRG